MIHVNVFGMPKTTIENEDIYFPFRKAEALFYYLAVEKKASRDSLVHLFWCDVDDQTAKKNLRNALYIIKKTLDSEVFKKGSRAVVELNEDVVQVDIDHVKEQRNWNALFEKGVFLEGFHVKDADPFEAWMFQMRDQLQDKMAEHLQQALDSSMQKKQFEEAKSLCFQLLKLDEFDEAIYRKLMEIYAAERRYNRCIEIYQQLSETLDQELGIEPDLETTQLFEKIMKDRTASKKTEMERSDFFFFGREQEFAEICIEFDAFKELRRSQSLLITGEAGIGKTALLNRFIQEVDEDQFLIFRTACFQAEENFYYKPWDEIMNAVARYYDHKGETIPSAIRKMIGYLFPTFISQGQELEEYEFEKLDVIKNHVVERAILDLLDKIARDQPLLILVEDVHWMDRMSLTLFKSLLMQNKNRSIFMVFTGRKGEYDPIEKIAAEGAQYGTLRRLLLERFNYRETAEFAQVYLKGMALNEGMKSQVFKETEGNPFFMVEILNHIRANRTIQGLTPKMQDVLKSRMNLLSDSAKKIINIVSVFFDKVSFESLSEISGLVDYDLTEAIEELINNDLINEVVTDAGSIDYRFTHQKLRDFVYDNLSLSKRRILNKRVAESLERTLKHNYQDRLIYSRLVYHFEQAGNKVAAVKYSISNLYDYMQMNYETFPVINSNYDVADGRGYSEEEIETELDYIGSSLEKLAPANETQYGYRLLLIRYLHMLSRYHIKVGNFDQGIEAAKKMISLSEADKHVDYMIKGYLQLIFYAINSHDTRRMQHYINLAIELAKQEGMKFEIGILLRLKGFQKILTGDFQGGERSLNNALKVFESFGNPDKYVLNSAAVYYYIGESYRLRQAYEIAIEHYEKAIEMCENANRVGRLTIFYTNAGHAAYDLGDLERASNYLEQALKLYNMYDFRWGRSTACAFMALIESRMNDYEKAEQHIKEAEKYAKKLNNPYEWGLVYRAKTEMCCFLKEQETHSSLYLYIEKDLDQLCQRAVYEKHVLDRCYEIDVVRKIEEICKDCNLQ